ncbi:hypothetical protein [Halopseudomonas litoralis]|nr:hypothetical protein [Halopseudomonas litoralis]
MHTRKLSLIALATAAAITALPGLAWPAVKPMPRALSKAAASTC